METAKETTGQTRQRIMDAAMKLFEHYGFNKTTMNEIAEAVNMSPANIYRFYKGKEDILFEIANSIIAQLHEALGEVLKLPGLTASERLEKLVVQNLRNMDMICNCHARLDEAVQYLKARRPDLVEKDNEAKRSMVMEVLKEGSRTGEFSVQDTAATAGYIMNATFLCQCQWGGKCPPMDEVENTAMGVVKLIINGLRPR